MGKFLRPYGGQVVKLEAYHSRAFDKLLSPVTTSNLRRYIVNALNKAGANARKITQNKHHTPFLTGELMRSIRWDPARPLPGQKIYTGSLSVNVPYGRRQEFEHQTKAFYLLRALQRSKHIVEEALSNKNVIGDILLNRSLGSVVFGNLPGDSAAIASNE